MARAIWSGSISFGLVNIPVKLHTAVRGHDVHFHLLTKDGKCRLRQKLFCPDTGKEYEYKDTARGYEVGPDQYVIVRDEELSAIGPEARRTIEIQDFVDLDEIDPVYFDSTYYLMPEENGAKAYRLLFEAMSHHKKVAIATLVMRHKGYLAALRPMDDGMIALETMHYADEVASVEEVGGPVGADVKVDRRELEAAERLIEALVHPFQPEKYKDEYRERVMEMVERKAQGQTVVAQAGPAERPHRVINLMEALQKSIDAARHESERKPPRRTHPANRKTRTVQRKGAKKTA